MISFPRTKASTQPSKPFGLRSSSPALPSSPLGGGPSSASRTSPRFIASPTTNPNSPRLVPASASSSSLKDRVASNETGGVRASQREEVAEPSRVGGWRGESGKASSSTLTAGDGGNAEEEEEWEPSPADDFFASVVEPSSRGRGRAGVDVGGGVVAGDEASVGVGISSKRPLGRSKRAGV